MGDIKRLQRLEGRHARYTRARRIAYLANDRRSCSASRVSESKFRRAMKKGEPAKRETEGHRKEKGNGKSEKAKKLVRYGEEQEKESSERNLKESRVEKEGKRKAGINGPYLVGRLVGPPSAF